MKIKSLDVIYLVGALIAVMVLLALKYFSSIWANTTAQALSRASPLIVVVDAKPPMSTLDAESLVPEIRNLPDYDRRVFARHLKTRFPRYSSYFKAAAQRHGIPWKLLAAQAYQESHWDWKAMSPTGVRGIMMLTKLTAVELGVSNRLDPVQSIYGGARYLAQIERRLPGDIHWSDRTLFALAAYNVGLGHVKDARILAKNHGLDPNRWRDLRSVLPLLSVKRYYKALPHGFARGREPVRYVDRIRLYHTLLESRIESGSQIPRKRDSGIRVANRLSRGISRRMSRVSFSAMSSRFGPSVTPCP